MSSPEDLRAPLARVVAALETLRSEVLAAEVRERGRLSSLGGATRPSGENLIHYLALRNQDLRPLQRDLQTLGLSSLGRAEARVLPTLDRLHAIARAAAFGEAPVVEPASIVAAGVIEARAARLFGARRDGRSTRILVTLEASDIHADRLVRLISKGMDAARINAAHDNPKTWKSLVDAVRAAGERAGRYIPILFDLPGPKMRTGPLPDGPRVAHARVLRDVRGVPIRATTVRLSTDQTHASNDVDLSVPLLAPLVFVSVGDTIWLSDCRGDRRPLVVLAMDEAGVVVGTKRTLWIETGAALYATESPDSPVLGRIGILRAVPSTLTLKDGDVLELSSSGVGGPAVVNEQGVVEAPAHITLSDPWVFRDLRPGEPVLFDDGKIHARVLSTSEERVMVQIVGGKAEGESLGAEKGVAFPASHLSPGAFGAEDEAILQTALSLGVDVVGLSFASSVEDVRALRRSLGDADIGVLLKIETAAGVRALPGMLLEALRQESVGVMIARGDLAVQVGFERLAELQEEILWIAEAAHVPVVWATEVLDRLARRGRPTRAEVTDAAMAERAECVMLNKGAHLDEAVTMLNDILKRMQAHQQKKTPLLRRLGLASFVE